MAHLEVIEDLHWELSVLSRAVAYSNLSGAASQIGISQPQLSRIVAKIESHLKVVLLDRGAKRKSGWTPTAFKLAEHYSKGIRKLGADIQKVTESYQSMHLKVGTLEGLVGVATSSCHHLLKSGAIRILELDIYDLNQLEEFFFRGEFDLIFTSREPGRKKYRYSKTLGYQNLERVEKGKGAQVLSAFEFGTRQFQPRENGTVIVSNSLDVRRNWIQKFGGSGVIPSEIRQKKEGKPVLLIGMDDLNPVIWEKISESRVLGE